nr:hypothetical protein [Tanacetum cinerariifolium]
MSNIDEINEANNVTLFDVIRFLSSIAMGSSVRGGYKLSNESLLEILLCNIFIMNFLVRLSTKELWNTCAQYDRVVWIDVVGTPLQAWAYDTFNRIAMILEGKVSVVRAKEVMGGFLNLGRTILLNLRKIVTTTQLNYPSDVEKSPGKMENSFDHVENYDVYVENSLKIFPEQLENSLIHIENYLVHVESSPEHMENFPNHIENSSVHVENSHVHVENSPDLSGDPFGNEVMENVAREGISSLGTIKSVPKNMSLGGSKHDHVDSLASSPKPINGKWLAIDSELLFMSVYSPQDMPHKRQLWAYMTGIINHWHGDVVIMGDFNKACFTSKQHGFIFHASNAAEFSTFITNSHLIDVPLGLILHRHIFYYKPIILKESHMDYGPTPFRLFHSWFIEDSWNNDGVHASNAMILRKNKLKSLKQTLKTWSIQKKSIREHDRRVLQDYLLEVELRLDKGEGLSDNFPNLAKTSHDIGVIDHKISVDLAPKAKVRWPLMGSRILSSFTVLLTRKDVSKFSARDWSRVPMEGIFLRHLGVDSSHDLEGYISNDEIKKAVYDCRKEQALLLKVDIQKAFNLVRYDHRDDIL